MPIIPPEALLKTIEAQRRRIQELEQQVLELCDMLERQYEDDLAVELLDMLNQHYPMETAKTWPIIGSINEH
jgi:hypothetical protein